MPPRIDRKVILAHYGHLLERRARLSASDRHSETYNNIWRWKMELRDMLVLAGFGYVLRLDDEVVREHARHAVSAALGLVRLPLESPPVLTRPSSSPSSVKTIVHKPTGQTVQVEITRLGSVQGDSFGVEQYERRFPLPPGARSGWEIASTYDAVAALAAFGEAAEAREAASMPEAWYRSNELIAEEAAFAGLRGLKACILGDEGAAREACNETIATARNDALREKGAAILALLEGREQDFRLALLAHVTSYAKDRSRTRQYERMWLQLVALVLCRLARSRGIEVEESWELPLRLIHPGRLL